MADAAVAQRRADQFAEALRHKVVAETRPLQPENVIDGQFGGPNVATVDSEHRMVRGDPQTITAAGLQLENRLSPG